MHILEYAPTNRTFCKRCGEKIKKKELRLKMFYNRFTSSLYWCQKCAEKQLDDDIEYLNILKGNLRIENGRKNTTG